MKRFIIIAIFIFIYACGNNSADEDSRYKEVKTVKVTTMQLAKSSVPLFLSFSGTATSNNTTMLVPKVIGYIEKFNFAPGEKFKKGDTLLIINSKELEDKMKIAQKSVESADNALHQSQIGLKVAKSQLSQAQSQFNLAEKTFNRFRNLLKSESVSQQEFDQIELKYKAAFESQIIAKDNVKLAEHKINQVKIKKQQAKTGLSEVRTYLSYSRMEAPYDGILLEKIVDVGNLASPGQPIAKIGSLNSAVYTYFNEKVLSFIKIGDSVKVEVGSLGLVYESHIVEISPNIDPATRNFKVKLEGHSKIVSGMYVKVLLAKGIDDVLLVPLSAVIKRGQLSIIFVNINGLAEMRFVKVGKTIDGNVEIRSGLKEGDIVVTSNVQELEAGNRLEE